MDDKALPLTEHLAELRGRIGKILLAWVLATTAAWFYSEEIFRALLEPAITALGPDGGKLQAISPAEIFFTYLKTALLVGFVAAAPVVFWQIWAFIAPGLYPSEKKAALPFVAVSTALFAGGALFAHQLVFPKVFSFFASFRSDFVDPSWAMREVFSLTTQLILAFGVCFEMPVVVFFLALSGIVTPRQLFGWTKYAVLVSFVIAAVLTPTPDVVTQTLLAGPLIALYLLGVAVAWVVTPRAKSEEKSAVAAR
ncbi:MAG: twin-arginine translocase subunit TatC [Deltaproteobacteria bacterium]|nr:twin-arginine translocase subunit TatC [Deltaproteobacteria bacterium]